MKKTIIIINIIKTKIKTYLKLKHFFNKSSIFIKYKLNYRKINYKLT